MAKSLKWVAAAVFISVVIIISSIAASEYLGIISLNSTPLPGQPTAPPVTGAAYAGPIKISTPFLIFNQTAVAASANNPDVILLHADKTNVIGSSTGATAYVEGTLLQSDNGVAYMLVSPNGVTTYGLLDKMTADANQGVIVGQPTVVLFQGQPWTCYELNLEGLTLAGGLTQATTTVNIYGFTSVTATLTTLLNSTALTNTSYSTATTSAYFSGFTGAYFGQGYKITRMQMVLNATDNATAYDNGLYKLTGVSINMGNGVVYNVPSTAITWNGVSVATIEIGSPSGQTYLAGSNTNQQFYGLPVLVGQNDSPQSLTISAQWYGKLAADGDSLQPYLKIYTIDPTGSLGTATVRMNIS